LLIASDKVDIEDLGYSSVDRLEDSIENEDGSFSISY